MVAILRDTSWSMNGVWSNWAASLCLRVIEVAKKKRMKIGYVEFNHNIDKHVGSDGELFVSDYDAVSDRACSLDCQGITNYQLPLQVRAYTQTNIPIPRIPQPHSLAFASRAGNTECLPRHGPGKEEEKARQVIIIIIIISSRRCRRIRRRRRQ